MAGSYRGGDFGGPSMESARRLAGEAERDRDAVLRSLGRGIDLGDVPRAGVAERVAANERRGIGRVDEFEDGEIQLRPAAGVAAMAGGSHGGGVGAAGIFARWRMAGVSGGICAEGTRAFGAADVIRQRGRIGGRGQLWVGQY